MYVTVIEPPVLSANEYRLDSSRAHLVVSSDHYVDLSSAIKWALGCLNFPYRSLDPSRFLRTPTFSIPNHSLCSSQVPPSLLRCLPLVHRPSLLPAVPTSLATERTSMPPTWLWNRVCMGTAHLQGQCQVGHSLKNVPVTRAKHNPS